MASFWCKIYSKLTMKTPERHHLYTLKTSENVRFSDVFWGYRWRRFVVFIVNFEYVIASWKDIFVIKSSWYNLVNCFRKEYCLKCLAWLWIRLWICSRYFEKSVQDISWKSEKICFNFLSSVCFILVFFIYHNLSTIS